MSHCVTGWVTYCSSNAASIVEWGIQCQCWIPGSPLNINDHVNVTGTCLWCVTNLPLWLLQLKLVLVLRVPTRTSDRMSQRFPMNNIRVVLANWIITSALATRAHQPPVCQACIKWKLLLLEISTYVNLLAQMYTDYSTPVFFLLMGLHYRATQKVFETKVFQFVSVCLQSSWLPALRESSCLSVTANLFSEMRAKALCVALQ